MYVLIALVGALFMKSGLLPNTGSYLSGDLGANIFGTIPESQILWRILGINDLNFWGTLALNAGIPITGLYLTTLIAPFSSFLGLLVLVVGLTPVLIWFVIAIAMFFLFLRLLIFFVGTYIKILIALIFGPFILLTEALPGGKGFESWFKGLVGNLLIFPASTIMFMLSGVFINLSNTKSTIWAPPYSSIINNTTSIGTVVGLGILFMIPTIGKQITDMFKVKSSMDVGAAGAALAQAVTSPFGTLIQGVSLGANIKMLGGDQLYGKFKSVAQKERK